jgi:hypothetical protein
MSDSKSKGVLALGAAFGAALSYLAYSSYASKKKQLKSASLAWDPSVRDDLFCLPFALMMADCSLCRALVRPNSLRLPPLPRAKLF